MNSTVLQCTILIAAIEIRAATYIPARKSALDGEDFEDFRTAAIATSQSRSKEANKFDHVRQAEC